MADPVEGVVEEFQPPVMVQVSAEDIAALIADDAQAAKAAKIAEIRARLQANDEARRALMLDILTTVRAAWLAVWKDRVDALMVALFTFAQEPPRPWRTTLDASIESIGTTDRFINSARHWMVEEDVIFFDGSIGERWDMRAKRGRRKDYPRDKLPASAAQWVPFIAPLVSPPLGDTSRETTCVGRVSWRAYDEGRHDRRGGPPQVDFPFPRPPGLTDKLMAEWRLINEQVDLSDELDRLEALDLSMLTANARIEITRAAVEASPEASAVRANVLASLDAVITPRLGVKP